MEPYALLFSEIDATRTALVGGKGANLGEMTIAGFPVPPGFCVTTVAYREFASTSAELSALIDELAGVSADDLIRIGVLGRRIREHLASLATPEAIRSAVLAAWRSFGVEHSYAVRSSATAEDLPSASFAGQQDTYLNVQGEARLLDAVRKCWASLFTDRAIAYRARNAFDNRSVFLAVVVQRMIFPDVSGIMFTADPISGHRQTVSIDASFGLGEALVSGLVTADLYQVRAGPIVTKRIARKPLAIYPRPDGGTTTAEIPAEQQAQQALPDDRILELAGLGMRIEAHYGQPQDIEWCFADGGFFIVQSRPITTLYPAPNVVDGKLHLFFSFGHVQMMTEPMKPLGISAVRTIVPAGERAPSGESELFREAGSRLFVDLNPVLRYERLRNVVLRVLPLADAKVARAVAAFLRRPEFLAALRPAKHLGMSHVRTFAPILVPVLATLLFRDVRRGTDGISRAMAESVSRKRELLNDVSGPQRIVRIRETLRSFFPELLRMKVVQNFAPGVLAFRLIERLSLRWLGDAHELASLGKSPPGNVTTEMGLAVGDLADVVRAHPGVIEHMRGADDATLLTGMRAISGGEDVGPAFQAFLERYGMRGTGEVDITRPRWRESPTQLVPAIEAHLGSAGTGQHRRDFLAGEREAERAAATLLTRIKATPFSFLKVRVMRRLIAVYRARIGLREHPKYYLVQILDLAKRGILQEAGHLTDAGLLRSPDEIFWYSLAELEEILTSRRVDRAALDRRREQFAFDATLRPPRVITSEGEIVDSPPAADMPARALTGSPASAGIVEGRARVVRKLEAAKLERGEILVAPYTDPAWTPLFAIAAGVVTEVGGLMTHGAVVAREYGIPAVVGVDNATSAISDGHRIRVNGTEGYVEILDSK
jgi:pyruvate,water dikinase